MLKVDRAVEGCFHRRKIDMISSSSEIPVSLLSHFAHCFCMSVHILASQAFFPVCSRNSTNQNKHLWFPKPEGEIPSYYFKYILYFIDALSGESLDPDIISKVTFRTEY